MPNRLIIADTDPPELALFGVIGFDFFDDFFTDREVLEALAEVGRSTDIIVRLNTPGGLLPAGKAIYNAFSTHRGKITMSVEAMAASSGSLIAMAGNEIIMRQGALMMVHNPSVFTMGDVVELEKQVSYLKAEAAGMIDIYSERTGQKPEEVRAQLDAETWLTGAEALKLGYCDKVENGSKAKAIAAFPYEQLYEHPPKEIVAFARKRGWSRADFDKDKPLMPPGNPTNPNPPNPPGPTPANPPDPGNPNPNPGTPAMNAADIVDACNAGGVPALASALIRSGATSPVVHERIATAKQIVADVANARTKFSGIPPTLADELIASGADLAHAQSTIWQRVSQAQAVVPTNTQLPTGPLNLGPAAQDPSGKMDAAGEAAWAKAISRANARMRPGQPFYAGSIPETVKGPGAPQQ